MSKIIKAKEEDLEFLNNLIRKQNKELFPFVTPDQIEERVRSGFVYISEEKNYCELIRIYKRRSPICEGITAEIGDINLYIVAASETGKGIGTKYRKKMLKKFTSPGRRFFHITRHDNTASIRMCKKCGFKFAKSYLKNERKYKLYIYTCPGKREIF